MSGGKQKLFFERGGVRMTRKRTREESFVECVMKLALAMGVEVFVFSGGYAGAVNEGSEVITRLMNEYYGRK